MQPENNMYTCLPQASRQQLKMRKPGSHELPLLLTSTGHTCLRPVLWNKDILPTLLAT